MTTKGGLQLIPEFDDSSWPKLRVSFAQPQSGEDLDLYLETLGAYLKRSERFGLVGTSNGNGVATPGLVKRQMAWMEEHAEALGEIVVGMSSVVEGAKIGHESARGASLSARLPFPMEAFSSHEEAEDWLSELLENG